MRFWQRKRKREIERGTQGTPKEGKGGRVEGVRGIQDGTEENCKESFKDPSVP